MDKTLNVTFPSVRRAIIIAIAAGFGLLFFLLVTAVLVRAATVSKSNSTPGFADRSEITRTVTFTGADFSAGAQVSNLTLSLTVEKVDTSCGNYSGGSVFNREIYILLTSPSGTDVVLVENVFNDGGSGNSGTFTSNTVYNGVVTIEFDDAASSQIGGPAPDNGTFRPEQPFSTFLGEDPLGEWVVTIGDHSNGAPFCFEAMTLTVDGDQPPQMADQSFTIAEDVANGTAVGTVAVSDDDPNEKFTFAEIGGSGAAVFEIDVDLGVISVTDSSQLDFENPSQNQFTYIVEVTDSGALTDTATMTINVTNGNDAPTDIALSSSSVLEHQPVGTAVGTLTTTDQDSGDSHLYTLISGSGDDDNSQFTIDGDTLETAASFDFESKDSYFVRIQTDDQNGGLFAKPMTITIVNGNDPPTDITLDSQTIQENQPISTTVGTLTATDPNSDTPTYQLVAGLGDDDNGNFTIVGDELKNTAVFDYESGSITYSVRIEADDQNGGLYEKAFTITVTDADDAATDFDLSNQTISESVTIGTAVGTFNATDIDGGSYSYSLVTGAGDGDNGDFSIVGDELQTAVALDYESQMTHTIRVELNDGITTIEKSFTISITNSNEAPTDVTLSDNRVGEEEPVGTVVGLFTAVDEDGGDTHTYTLVSGSGDADNGSFQIMGDALQTAVLLDYETKITHTIRIEVADNSGATFQKVFNVIVEDGNDSPTDISLSNSTVGENEPSGTPVGTLTATDPNGDLTITYSLPAGTPDNSAFQVVGDELQTAVSLDFEDDPTYNILVEANDGNGGTYQEAMTITVTDANDAPTFILLTPDELAENQPISTTVGSLTAVDQDPDSHTFALVSGAGDTHNNLFDIVGTDIKSLTTFDFESALTSYSIRVETQDGNGGIFTQTLSIDITDANDPPTDITLNNSNIPEDLTIGEEVGAFDTVDEDTFDDHTYTLVPGAGDTHNALFDLTDEILATNALFDYESGNITYTIRVESSDGDIAITEIFTLTVTDQNDAPVAMPDYAGATDEDSVLSVNDASGVLTNDDDEDGDALTVMAYDLLSAQEAFVTVSNSGGISYDPRPSEDIQGLQAGETVVDSFDYVVTDSGGMTATATVTVTITGINDDPTAVNDTIFVDSNSPTLIQLLDNDSDPEGDTITLDSFTLPTQGTLVDNGDGTLTYTPSGGYVGQDNFTYTIIDGEGGTATAQVTLNIGEAKVYLPLLTNQYFPAPDLIVTHISATAERIEVEITNQGSAPTSSGFWVDFYIAPNPVPTEVDQVWQDVAAEGIVWGVTDGLAPGESLTLVYSSEAGAPNLYYAPANSQYSGVLPAGTAVYAQVDSSALNSSFGGVLESHEIDNEAYNNVSSRYVATTSSTRPNSTIR